MTDERETLTELAEHILPFGRQVRLLDVDYHNGLHMLRLIWREGKRITQVDVDPENCLALGADILAWAQQHAATKEN
ncbi:MAG: hypothetical protein QNL16_08370 [Rhodobacterales bacterium]|jgi:hypothetical protein